MINRDLEKMREAWNNDLSMAMDTLSEKDINQYRMKSSRDITKLFRSGLLTDLSLKALLVLSFVSLLFLYPHQSSVMIVIGAAGTVSLAGLFYQYLALRMVPGGMSAEDSIRQTISKRIDYYNRWHVRSIFVGALTSALLIISGMLFYFYFEYGEVRPLEIDDFIVLGAIPVLGFILGAIIQFRHHNFHIRQIESIIDDIDTDQVDTSVMIQYRYRRRRMIVVYLVTFTAGLLVFLYFAFR